MSNPKEADKKTQLGLPPEVEAALKKRDAERQAAEATQIQQAPLDLQRTLYGNPHDAPNRPSAPRPQLPPNHAFVPPTARAPGATVATPTARSTATSSAMAPRGFVTTQRPPSAAAVSMPPMPTSAPSPFERTTLGVPDAASRSVSVAPTRPSADGSIVRQVRVVGLGTPQAPSAGASENASRTGQSVGRGLAAPAPSVSRAEGASSSSVDRPDDGPSQTVGRGLGGAPVGSGATAPSRFGRGIGAAPQTLARGISAPMQRIGVGSDGETRLAGSLSAEPSTRDARELAPLQHTKVIDAPSKRELNAAPGLAHAHPNTFSPTASYGENARPASPGLGFDPSQQGTGQGSRVSAPSRAQTSPEAASPKRPPSGTAGAMSQPSAASPIPAVRSGHSPSAILAEPAAARHSSGPLYVSAPAQRQDADAPAARGGASGSLLDTTEPDRDAPERKPSPPPAQLHAADSALAVQPARGSGALMIVPSSPPLAAGHPDPISDALGPGMQATRLVSMEAPRSAWYVRSSSAPGTSSDDGSSRSGIAGKPPLALHVAEPDRQPAPVRRWPALVLIGLALVMFTGVIAVRAPALLPAPIAHVAVALIASVGLAPHSSASPAPVVPVAEAVNGPGARVNEQVGAATSAQANDPSTTATVRNEQVQANDPSVRNEQVAAAAQANDPPAVAPAQTNDPVPASPEVPFNLRTPSALQGTSAELEKQAIDALLANDFASARGLYERLRIAEPTRPEYPLMLELLARDPQATCDRPGQPACAVP